MWNRHSLLRYRLPALLALVGLLVMGCGRSGDEAEVQGEKERRPEARPVAVKPLPAPTDRSLWVRATDVVTQETSRVEFIEICKEADIDGVFVNMSPFPDHQYDPRYQQDLKRFARSVDRAGMSLHALRPMPLSSKLVYPKAQYVAVTYLRDFLKYNGAMEDGGRFEGVLLDVQPHDLPGWDTDEGGVQEKFVEFVVEMRRTVIEFGQGARLGWALPVSYIEYPWFGRLCEVLDYIVLTEAGDDPEASIDAARRCLARCGDEGARVLISADPWGAREGFGEQAAGQLGRGAFGGVAIDDYSRLRETAGRPGD